MTPDEIEANIATLRMLSRAHDTMINSTTATSNRLTAICRDLVKSHDQELAAATVAKPGMTKKEEAAVKRARVALAAKAKAMADQMKKEVTLKAAIAALAEEAVKTPSMTAKETARADRKLGALEKKRAELDEIVAASPIRLATQGYGGFVIDLIVDSAWELASAHQRQEKHRDKIDTEIEKTAKKLPIAPWAATVTGLSLTQCGLILGATGNLSNYKSVAAVWMRLGLGVVNGRAQRRVKGPDAVAQKFRPENRSLMFNIETCIIKHAISGPKEDDPDNPGEQRRVEGAASIANTPLGERYLHYRRNLDVRAARGETFWRGVHKEACRRMVKEMVKQMWVAWKIAVDGDVDVEERDPWKAHRMMQKATSPTYERWANS